MTQPHFRPLTPADYPAVKQIIDEAFFIHRYAPTPSLLASALEVDFGECLVSSTYAQVVELGGKPIAILMGQVTGQPKLPGRAKAKLKVWAHLVKIALIGFRHRHRLNQYFAFQQAYKELRAQTQTQTQAQVPLTDELTLFAVRSQDRGTGIGTVLFSNFQTHLKSHQRRSFYLFTDSQCTYQFYERRGMKQIASTQITQTLDSAPQTLDIYLYSSAIP